ncbi:sensor histidine kinase [Terrarubrum flagellatum]|uniref:sensor histidine kinase n=1 Tax=Terrirubrum flagellatum TaxID=2895980 RepID=UPI00314501B8
MKWPRPLSLRWRLVVAFVLVSAPPVLIASYLAAQAIAGVFQQNVERWLNETSLFLVSQVNDAVTEADRSASTIATALSRDADLSSSDSIKPYAELLAAAGYDYVRIEDENGTARYASGATATIGSMPHRAFKSVLNMKVSGATKLAIAAVRPFDAAGARHYVLVSNILDERFFTVSQGIKSLDVRVTRLEDGKLIGSDGDPAKALPISTDALQSLMAGAESVVALGSPDDEVATAYAAIRDDQSHLVGVVLCRVSSEATGLEGLSKWQLFVALALIAGAISTVVGFFLAERISRPVRALTRGLRAVAGGDYQARVPEEGGQELERLAAGFNAMTEQLGRLQAMESDMRRRQQFAVLGEAAAMIAHEIRNPLGIIKTSSQVVRMRSALKPSEDRLIGFVLDEVGRIDRLVQDILDYARPRETRKCQLDLMADVVARVIAMAAPEMQKHNVECDVAEPGESMLISGDPDQLHQVLLNLILNALDAMPEKGRLTIRAERAGDVINLIVSDTGAGIEPQVLDRIFDPFFSTKAKGAGLGLARSRGIIEEHGGTISCRSEPGHGAEFTIRLPALSVTEKECVQSS